MLNPTEIIIVVSLMFGATLIRVWPYFIRYSFATDPWFHQWRVEEIKKNNYRVPKEYDQFILRCQSSYPPLLHYLMLLFPEKHREKYSYFISTFFDLVIFFLFFYLWKNGIWIGSAAGFMYAVAIYFFSPIGLQFHATSTYAVKARSMGRFFLLCQLVLFYLYAVTGQGAYLAGSSLAFALVLLSSKFALQVALFVSLFVSWTYPAFALTLLFGFLISVVISGGFVFRVLREHIVHQYTYFKKAKYYGTASRINNPEDIKYIVNLRNLFRDPIRYLGTFAYKVSYTQILLVVPLVVLTVILALTGSVALPSYTHANDFIYLWALGCIFAFLLTSTKTFISLGQPCRYIEYAIFPLALIVAASTMPGVMSLSHLILFYAFFYCIANAYYLLQIFKGQKAPSDSDGYQSVKDHLEIRRASRIVCVPMKMAYKYANNHMHKYLWTTPYFPMNFYDDVFKYGRSSYPKSLVALREKYGLDTVIINENHHEEYREDLKKLSAREDFRASNLVVYSI